MTVKTYSDYVCSTMVNVLKLLLKQLLIYTVITNIDATIVYNNNNTNVTTAATYSCWLTVEGSVKHLGMQFAGKSFKEEDENEEEFNPRYASKN